MTYATHAGSGNAADDLNSLLGPDAALVPYADLDPRFRDDNPPSRLVAHPNPLLAAASRLLVGLAPLKPHRDEQALGKLRARLGRRVSRFARQALQAGVGQTEVRVASYVLCTVADEAVLTQEWGQDSDWASDSLLHAFHDDTLGGEKFFLLLERFMAAPARHIDQLELMHVCLALGFQGCHAAATDNGKGLLRLRHELFQRIERVRGEPSPRVSLVRHLDSAAPPLPTRLLPARFALAASALCLGILYVSLAWKLGQHREQALAAFLQVEPAEAVVEGGAF